MFASSCTSPCTKWNRLWKDKCWNKSRYSCIHQNNLIDMETLRNIDVPLVSSLLTRKDSTPFFSISLLSLGKYFWLCLPAEMKAKTSKYYETCHIKLIITNYAILTKWVKVQHERKRIKFKKYADCRFWANIYKIYNISVAISDSSDVVCFDLCLINIFANLQRQRDAQT